jgi:hypothetical protein
VSGRPAATPVASGRTAVAAGAAEPFYGLTRMNKGSDSGRVAGDDVAS